MATAALEALSKNLTRARYFIDLHEGMQAGPGTPDKKRRELPRGALVFAVGALDAYLSEVSAEVMLAQFDQGAISGPNRDVLREVLKLNPTLALEAAMAGPGVDTRALVRETITKHFYDEVSNHGAKAVAAAAARMGGTAKAIWAKVEAAGEKQPAADLDDWTDKRHQIVHQGKAVVVNREPARRCIELITRIASAVDEMASELIAAQAEPAPAA